MARFIKKRSEKSGLPPGTLVHIGDRRDSAVRLSIMDYDETKLEEKPSVAVADCRPYRDKPTVTWIDVEGIHHIETIEKLGEDYGIHPLALEDIVATGQRPKIEDFEDYLFLVLNMLGYDSSAKEIRVEQVSFVLGKNYLLSLQEGIDGDLFNNVRERIRENKGKIRKLGADYLLYSLIDSVVDHYFVILEKLGDEIETLEDEVLARPGTGSLHAIHRLKRELIFLRKSVWPLRDVINILEKGESPLIREGTGIYLRDLYDHTIQVIDTIETYRDMIAGILDIYLSSISNKMNEIMKVLTVISTIFIPLTFIAGVYGMNFPNMPEIHWPWGYPAVILVMLSIGILMLVYFKKKKWF